MFYNFKQIQINNSYHVENTEIYNTEQIQIDSDYLIIPFDKDYDGTNTFVIPCYIKNENSNRNIKIYMADESEEHIYEIDDFFLEAGKDWEKKYCFSPKDLEKIELSSASYKKIIIEIFSQDTENIEYFQTNVGCIVANIKEDQEKIIDMEIINLNDIDSFVIINSEIFRIDKNRSLKITSDMNVDIDFLGVSFVIRGSSFLINYRHKKEE